MGSSQCCGVHEQISNENKSISKEQYYDDDEFSSNDSESIILEDFDGKQQICSSVGIKNFRVLQCIGRGSFGKVMLVQNKNDNKFYAMKSMRKSNVVKKQKYIEQTKTEKLLLQNLNHPYMIRLYFAFQTKLKLYLVMDLINGGELFFHLRREKYFPEKKVQFYCAEVLLALEYLHLQKIIYRDLKPENILVDGEGHIKLTDFGLAKRLVNDKTYTFCGTPEYVAPEILLGSGYSYTTDWWSFGIIMYEMLIGQPPYQNRDKNKLFKKIIKGGLRIPQSLSPESVQILQGLLKYKPEERLGHGGADEIKKQPFFKDINWDLLEHKKITPPWIPKLKGPDDLTYIDRMFTDEYPQDTALTKLDIPNQSAFKDFSYEHTKNQQEQPKQQE